MYAHFCWREDDPQQIIIRNRNGSLSQQYEGVEKITSKATQDH
jgi:hypothetical protein